MVNISIDIDGVLMDREKYQFEKAVAYAKNHNLNCNVLKPSAYNVDEMFGWDKQDFTDFWNEYLWDYAKIPPFDGAKETLKKLRSDGHKIIINSSRWLSERDDEVGERMRRCVKDWFENFDIPYDELVFARGDKVSVIKRCNAHCHIEDNPFEAEPIASKVPVIMFDASYNREYCGINILHAKTWGDVYDIIHTICRGQQF